MSAERPRLVYDAETAPAPRVRDRPSRLHLAAPPADPRLTAVPPAPQLGTVWADLAADPPDARLIDRFGLTRCLAQGVLPWRRVGGAVLVAAPDAERFHLLRPALETALGPVRLALAPDAQIRAALLASRGRRLVRAAEARVPAPLSCRRAARPGGGWLWVAAGLAGLAGLIAAPGPGLIAIILWAVVWMAISTGLRAAAALAVMTAPAPAAARPPAKGARPTISVLVPLYKERMIAGHLIARLSKLTYPKDRLEICLVVEADDTVTRETLAGIHLPPWMQTVTVPSGSLKTKPRALNYALNFCRGSIIGVYDAEDAPAPDQLECVADRFARAAPDVACLQGILDFYNARQNWLARCFAIEYAAWFRVILPGFARLGLVLPLGGTTLFFRRDVLEEIGAWDSHNVTEDADLGVRLARAGYRTELIDSVTAEEANAWVWPWVRQRSRWLKGYAQTWAVHMRAPGQLMRDLGPWRFFGVQALFLGTLTQFLLMPAIWSFWLLIFGFPHLATHYLPMPVLYAIWGLFVLSEVVNVGVGALGLARSGRARMAPWLFTLQLYFPLATLALLKGLAELTFKPFYWDKTSHGASVAGAPGKLVLQD